MPKLLELNMDHSYAGEESTAACLQAWTTTLQVNMRRTISILSIVTIT